MKYSGVVFFIAVAFVVFAAEARLKRKFDSDFVFAEDVSFFWNLFPHEKLTFLLFIKYMGLLSVVFFATKCQQMSILKTFLRHIFYFILYTFINASKIISK